MAGTKKPNPNVKAMNSFAFKDVTDFKEISNFLGTIDKAGSLLSESDATDIQGWCSTGSYIMNAHFSGSIFGGIPLGRMTAIAGDPKTGKSYFALQTCKELQQLGYFIQMYETEASPDKDRFASQKLNPDQFKKTPVKHIEDVIHWIAATNDKLWRMKQEGKAIPKIAYVIDSWNGLITQKDEEDAIAGNLKSDMGHFAKLGKKLANIYSIKGAELGIPLIITCHVYEKDMGNNFRQRTVSGGNGIMYFASLLPMLKRKKVTEGEGQERETVGVMVSSTLSESRYAKPTTVDIYIDFKKGINKYFGLLEYCTFDTVGVGPGSYLNSTDFVSLLLNSKKVTKDTIVGFAVSDDYLKKTLSKSAYGTGNSVKGTFNHFVAVGYIDNGKFTKKILERFDKDGKYTKFEDKIAVQGGGSGTYIARHLPGETFSHATVHQSKVFTQEVLEKLDVIMKPYFQFGEEGIPTVDPIDEARTIEEEIWSTEE